MSKDTKKIFIRTFGCQMNVRDSEIIKGLLLDNGFKVVDEDQDNFNAILFVTCSVRQHAEDRVWSEIGRFSKLKPKPVIGLVGCMAENYKQEAFKRMPGIDLVVGTNNIGEIPQLLKEIFTERRGSKEEDRKTENESRATNHERRILAVGKARRDEVVYRPEFRQERARAFVVISEGCDNFCSYCVVPYVRGELRHRPPESILKEIKFNIDKGVESITLIGQNVNAYKYNGTDFVRLLESVNSIPGLGGFSFISSHPKDIAGHLFKTIASLEKLEKYLHLPVQSGSDRILRLMKRGYSRRRYLGLIDEYRRKLPGARLTTDIIVGFPGEGEDDFRKTTDLVERARFSSAYIFKYSPRPNTEAEKLKDDVPKEEKQRRHRILLDLQRKISHQLKTGK
jgi:tRNA-2-methylthio-N6-dimethylallyladenosine synthase